MIIMFQNSVVFFPGSTQEGAVNLFQTMAHAVNKFNKDGRPQSGDY